jgi:prolyl-tRNA synthetase
MTAVHTPDLPGIKGVAEFLGVEPSQMLKSIAFDVDGEMGLALVPGDREVNPFALNQALAGRKVRLWEDADFDASPDVPRGYIGPHFPGATVRVADPAVRVGAADGWVTGANQVDHHVRHAALGRDFDVDTYADLVTVVTGDPCPRCGSPLSVDRGIEVGHTFQLGTKYSVALGAEYTDETGQQHPMVMGCYGIGVSRVVAAAVEEHHDASGLMWPAALAPYQVHLVSLPGKGEAAPEVRAAADRLYDELRAAGVDVLYDDRDQSPGVKFADADLLGVPTQLILGAKGLARGVVERKDRRSGERDEVALDAAAGVVSGG